MDKVFCRTTSKGIQSFYIKVENCEYFLFAQSYRVSVKEHFRAGISINECMNYASSRSVAVRKTLDKLKVYIPYIEKEFGIAVYNKTKDKNQKVSRKRYLQKKNEYRYCAAC